MDHRPHSAARRRALPHRFVSPNGLTALAVSLLLAFGLPPQAAQAQEAPVRVSIAAQPLGSALVRIANEYSLELAYSPDIAVGRNAPAVSGNLTADQALRQVLAGTGIEFRRNGRNVSLSRPEQSSVTQLPTIAVVGSSLNETGRGPFRGYAATRSTSGTKTDTPILETPQSITVVGAEEMRDRKVAGFGDALNYVAGVIPVATSDDRMSDQAILRGFRADSSSFYRDGQKFSQNLYYDGQQEPYACERIEVLKGASSLLYGMAEPGGIVNCVTKSPTPEPIRELNLEYGSFDRKQVSGDLGGLLGKGSDWSYRLTFLARDSDSMVKHTPDDRAFFAGAVKWQPSAATSFELRADYLHSRTSHSSSLPSQGTLLPNPNGTISRDYYEGWPGHDIYTSTSKSVGYRFEHAFSDRLKLRQNATFFDRTINNPALTSVGFSADQTSSTSVSGLEWTESSHSITTDTSLEASIETGPVSHKLIGGFDTMRGAWKTRRYRFSSPGVFDYFDPQYDFSVQGALRPWNFFPDSEQQNTGLYVQDQMKIADRWVLLLGLRHDWYSSTSNYVLTTGESIKEKTEATTRRAGLVYLADYGIAPFISFSQSFVPVSGEDRTGSRFKPTEGEQYEAGIRWQPPGTSAMFSMAAYQLTKQNVTVSDPADSMFQTQLGEVRSRGIEIEARGEISHGTNVIAAYTYTDAKTTKSSPLTPDALGRTGGIPRNTFALWLDQDFGRLGLPGLHTGIGIRRMDSYPSESDNTLINRALTLVDFMASYTNGPWRFALNISNLADKRYATCTASNQCVWGESRRAIASVGYRW